MKVPERINKLIDRRAKLAWNLIKVDHELTKWLEKQGVDGDIDDCDYLGGCEMYASPDSSAYRIREAILKH